LGNVSVKVMWGGGTAILRMGGYALPGVCLIATTILATSAALAEVCALLVTSLVYI